jgi:hypothetical protein
VQGYKLGEHCDWCVSFGNYLLASLVISYAASHS